MDPLAAALNLANTIATIVKLQIEAMTPEQRQAQVTRQLELLDGVRQFVERIHDSLGSAAAPA